MLKKHSMLKSSIINYVHNIICVRHKEAWNVFNIHESCFCSLQVSLRSDELRDSCGAHTHTHTRGRFYSRLIPPLNTHSAFEEDYDDVLMRFSFLDLVPVSFQRQWLQKHLLLLFWVKVSSHANIYIYRIR